MENTKQKKNLPVHIHQKKKDNYAACKKKYRQPFQ